MPASWAQDAASPPSRGRTRCALSLLLGFKLGEKRNEALRHRLAGDIGKGRPQHAPDLDLDGAIQHGRRFFGGWAESVWCCHVDGRIPEAVGAVYYPKMRLVHVFRILFL